MHIDNLAQRLYPALGAALRTVTHENERQTTWQKRGSAA
jgi:hypothetical protein